MKKNFFAGAFLTGAGIASLMILAGCMVPHTRSYQPVGAQEKAQFNQATREVYPDDVRTNLAAHSSTVVAWPGIIRKSDVRDVGGSYAIESTLEHHYYDWMEDFSVQREKIFLARRGEGDFKIKWSLIKHASDTTVAEGEKAVQPGTLAIVYGVPKGVEGNTVVLEFRWVRLIESQWYTTNVFNYGRSGPITWLGK